MSGATGRCAYGFLVIQLLTCLLSPQLLAACDCGVVCNCPDCRLHEVAKEGRWHIVDSDNFHVCCDESKARAVNLAKHAEALCAELRTKFLSDSYSRKWTPRCEIVLHHDLRSYVSAVGRGSERTVGSSLVKTDKGQIIRRRIDLLGGETAFLTAALPHELTHVVLKERFVATSVPRWADEGLAILADSVAKRGRHSKDLRNAMEAGTLFEGAALLSMDDYPSARRFGVFYGQSASLTEFLVKRKSPQEFVDFIERAAVVGYDSALRTHYGIANVRELDRQWRKSVEMDHSVNIRLVNN